MQITNSMTKIQNNQVKKNQPNFGALKIDNPEAEKIFKESIKHFIVKNNASPSSIEFINKLMARIQTAKHNKIVNICLGDLVPIRIEHTWAQAEGVTPQNYLKKIIEALNKADEQAGIGKNFEVYSYADKIASDVINLVK